MSDPANLPTLRDDIGRPTSERSRADAYGFRDSIRRLPALNLPYNPLSTARRKQFLCMFIRSSRESLKPRNSSFLGQEGMDNLMKAHS